MKSARRRVNLALVTWHEGGEPAILDTKDIDEAYESAQTETKRDAAIAALGEKFDFDGEPTATVDSLISEAAFIEAMRDKHLAICRVKAVMAAIRKLHAKEMGVSGEMEPVMRLLPIPVKTLHDILIDTDARVANADAAFADFDETCNAFRVARNDLYRRMSAWDDVIEFWGAIDPRQPETFNLVAACLAHFRHRLFKAPVLQLPIGDRLAHQQHLRFENQLVHVGPGALVFGCQGFPLGQRDGTQPSQLGVRKVLRGREILIFRVRGRIG